MKSPKVMFAYAVFLVLCGLVAFAMAPEGARAGTALYASSGAAVLMVLCGILAMMYQRNRMAGMIGIHAGLVLPVVYGLMFAMLSWRRFTGDEPVVYLATIFAVMAVGSAIAFALVLMMRPAPEARG